MAKIQNFDVCIAMCFLAYKFIQCTVNWCCRLEPGTAPLTFSPGGRKPGAATASSFLGFCLTGLFFRILLPVKLARMEEHWRI